MIRIAIVILAAMIFSSCTSVPDRASLNTALNNTVKRDFDFVAGKWYALRSKAAYSDPAVIKKQIPRTSYISTTSEDIQYFIENPAGKDFQLITIRGTKGKKNVWEDIEFQRTKDNKLNIFVHAGFDKSARSVYEDILTHLDRSKKIHITGHSLGGAVAVLLGLYLDKDNYKVERVVTFGQPKITNQVGAAKYRNFPVIRVTHHRDVVPMLPPTSAVDLAKGYYEHFGPEVILLDGPNYVYKNRHDASRISVGELWRNNDDFSVKDHKLDDYIAALDSKLKSAKQVSQVN
jgi:triacylglycerol lipase